MKRFFKVLLLLLNCGTGFANIVVPTDYIQVVPTNATAHGVWFRYGQRAGDVFVRMAYVKSELPFDGATLECTNSVRHFNIPLKSIHPIKAENGQDGIWITFFMDRETLRECTLKITFQKNLERAIVYTLPLREFVLKEEAPAQR